MAELGRGWFAVPGGGVRGAGRVNSLTLGEGERRAQAQDLNLRRDDVPKYQRIPRNDRDHYTHRPIG
jgi:hypothetical protein